MTPPSPQPCLRPSPPREIRFCGKSLWAGPRPLVAGIVNVTPDSFFPAGRHPDPHEAVAHGLRLVKEGADLLDVGGVSTRPGAAEVEEEEEMARVLPVISALVAASGVPVSIDTTRARVAGAAFAAGASWLNDISALTWDPRMAPLAAEAGVAVVLMHMRGLPANMQENTVYEDLVSEVVGFLRRRLEVAQEAGVAPESLLVDPGIGFGKSPAGNLTLLGAVPALSTLGVPVYIGASRKSFLGARFGIPLSERLAGSLGAVASAVAGGAHVVRVHDVKETRQMVEVMAQVAVHGEGRP